MAIGALDRAQRRFVGGWVLRGLVLALACSGVAKAGAERAYGQEDYVELAYQYLETGEHGWPVTQPREALQPAALRRDARGNVHVRFRQLLDGVPVWNAELMIHLRDDGRVYHASGQLVERPDLAVPEVRISPENAVAIIRGLPDAGEAQVRVAAPQLYVDRVAGIWRPVYRIERIVELEREILFVDAHNGELVKRMSGSPTRK